jgi:phytoene dehydrogenase-like protein
VARKIPSQLGTNRPIPELADYRTPIEGLYQIGVATHPANAVTSGSGRNAWQIMKEDLRLELKERAPTAHRGDTDGTQTR